MQLNSKLFSEILNLWEEFVKKIVLYIKLGKCQYINFLQLPIRRSSIIHSLILNTSTQVRTLIMMKTCGLVQSRVDKVMIIRRK